jgi:D-alanyl-D-alanine carboxypeptidase
VLLGTQDSISLSLAEPRTFIVKAGAPPIETRVEVNRYALAPIKAGDALGKIVYLQNEEIIAEAPLLASEDVAALPVRLSLWDKIKKLFKM